MHTNRAKYIRLTTTIHLSLMMTSAQVVETSVTTVRQHPSKDYTHPDDQTTLLHVTPGLNHLLYIRNSIQLSHSRLGNFAIRSAMSQLHSLKRQRSYNPTNVQKTVGNLSLVMI